VERLIVRHSHNPVRISVGTTEGATPDSVDLRVFEVENDLKLSLLRNLLKDEEGSFLVFARTKHATDRLAHKLSAHGLRAVAMHGDRTQNQRNQALAGFRDGRYRVLVATDVAARGIHVDSVAHVVNYDLPQAPQDFIHRVGRTGRAGQRGAAWTFSSRSERGDIRRIERECKVRLVRREIGPDVKSERDEPLPEKPSFTAAPKHAGQRSFASPDRSFSRPDNGARRHSGRPFKFKGKPSFAKRAHA
jgi:ATP-dependent RNA helicase RhlE